MPVTIHALTHSAPPSNRSSGIAVPGATPLTRWIAFNAVGAVGMAVQLAVVATLVYLGCHYLVATVLAVESAIVHNFLWHQRWTWRDRPAKSSAETAVRLVRFHALNGTVSLLGNVGVTAWFTGIIGINPIVSNVVAIGVCSLVNFVFSETMVFSIRRTRFKTVAQPLPPSRAMTLARLPRDLAGASAEAGRAAWKAGLKPCATRDKTSDTHTIWIPPLLTVLLLIAAAPIVDAGPRASTLAAWRDYEARVDSRYTASSSGRPFFALDGDSQSRGWRDDVLHGQPRTIKIDAPSVDDGKIHHWVGAIFVPGTTVTALVDRLEQNAGHESEHYEDVLASRLIARDGDRVQVYLKLRRTNLITVTYNTEHRVDYRRMTSERATARSVATKIAELTDVGTPQEREKPASEDNGFLWRLNAYWRYEAVAGGVLVECESVSLSRPIPALLRPVANPIVDRIARESLNKTLLTLRTLMMGKASSSQLPASSHGNVTGNGSSEPKSGNSIESW